MKENVEHLNKYIRNHSRNSNKKMKTTFSKTRKLKSDKKLKSRSKSKSRKMNNMNSSFLGSLRSSSKARGSVYSSARRSSGRKSVNSVISRSGTQNSRRKQEVLPSNYYKS